MEQQRAINALESYIILSKDAKSPRAAADLIVRATSDPNTYVFAELPQGLVAKPVDGFGRLDVQLFMRRDESRSLILDFAELAIEQAARLVVDEAGDLSASR